MLEATRQKEAEVKKETLEQLDAFRKRQEEAERKALEEENTEPPKEDEAQWVAHGRKRKKGRELLKGVKLRRVSSAAEDTAAARKTIQAESRKEEKKPSAAAEKPQPPAQASPVKPTSASPPSKPSNALALGLGYASSDDDG